jgi:hypothetical protein
LLIFTLPAIDLVYCPDGCTDADRTSYGWQRDGASRGDTCGLCVNAVAVTSGWTYSPPARRLQTVVAILAPGFLSALPRSIDQPPRHS